MSSFSTQRIAAAVAFVVMVVVNGFAATSGINGVTTGAISDTYPNLFAPAGFTFSIWGVIYALLTVYTIYQFMADSPVVEAITVPFLITSILNTVWILCWHYDVIWLSMIIMVGLLVTLAHINSITTAQRWDLGPTLAMRLPFSVYFGWICVATVANAATLLVKSGWRGTGLSEAGWTIVTLIVAAVIGIATSIINKDLAVGLVFVWAYFGILSRHESASGLNGEYPDVITALQVLIVLLAVSAVLGLVFWIRQPVEPVDDRMSF